MIDNASKLFDRKIDTFPTLSFENIKDSNASSSSHGTSLASDLSYCADLTSNDSAGNTKTCERHLRLSKHSFLEEKTSSTHIPFKKRFAFEFENHKSISHEDETNPKPETTRKNT